MNLGDNTAEVESGWSGIVQNQMILITGLPGNWKSFLAAFLASFYREITSNLTITLNWQQVSNPLGSMKDLKNIKFSKVKWCVIIEEAGINVSSRSFMSEENMEFSALGMIARHKNKDMIVIAQLARTVDVNVRELCRYRFDMRSWRVWDGLMFEMTIYDRWGNILGMKEVDLIAWSKMTGYSYSTLEDSIIEKEPSKKRRQNPVNESNTFLGSMILG